MKIDDNYLSKVDLKLNQIKFNLIYMKILVKIEFYIDLTEKIKKFKLIQPI